MAATTTGQTEAIRWLVGKGADVNKVSQLEYGGRTALISAAEVGAVESARVLLELGANPHLKMKDGSTALSHALASSMKNDELIEIIKGALAKPPPTKAKAVSKP
jgi:ankyrin repeat protein